MANVFDFRPGRAIKNVNPNEVGRELERIRSQRGQLTPADVLEEAASPDSPLHAAFEWDDSEAAKHYRVIQARRLIVSVRVINSPVQAKVPAFVSVKTPDKGRNYMPTVEALGDEELKARVLLEIQQFVESMQRRYGHFQEAAEILGRLRQQAG